MTTQTTQPQAAAGYWRGVRLALVAALGALLGNSVIWAGATLAGVSFEVAQPSSASMTIGLAVVATVSMLAVLPGALLLMVTAPRSARAPRVLAWLGLAIGVLTMPMPFSVEAESGTRVALMSMHLLTGVIWWLALRHRGGGEAR